MNATKKLHAHLVVTGLSKHPSPLTLRVLLFYALSSPSHRHHHLSDAASLFAGVHRPDALLFNTVIRAFARSHTPRRAIDYYARMRFTGTPPDNRTFPFVLTACAAIPDALLGRQIHSLALKIGFLSDVFVSNALIHLYSSCNDLCCARLVFDEMPLRDLVSWNSLICGYSGGDCLREVLNIFETMRSEGVEGDKVTMTKVVSACVRLGEWDLAEGMVRYIRENGVEVDVYLGNTLIDYLGRQGEVEEAWSVFDAMEERNVVTMNAMITTLAKAGDLVSARRVFDGMCERNLVSWSAMITGYSQASQFSDALALFRTMQRAKVKPDEIVIVSVLSACAHLGALGLGRWIHDYIKKNEIRADVYVGNALIDMYSKCGSITQAIKVFREMKKKDILSWNSIILGLATNGYVESALEVFSDMLREGFQPDDLSFLGVLIACAHGGLVDEGLEYFESMKEVHGVEPHMKHYGCVVDLIGRSGDLDKAHKFISEMPIQPDPVVWRTLLGACKLHGDVDLAEIATKKLMELDPDNSGNYVLLSNTYASMNRWNDAMNVREVMVETDVQKTPGCSSIEVGDMRRAAFS